MFVITILSRKALFAVVSNCIVIEADSVIVKSTDFDSKLSDIFAV